MKSCLSLLVLALAAVGYGTTNAPSSAGEPIAMIVVEADYAAAASRTATWIRSIAVESDAGTAWPADPHDTGSVVTIGQESSADKDYLIIRDHANGPSRIVRHVL